MIIKLANFNVILRIILFLLPSTIAVPSENESVENTCESTLMLCENLPAQIQMMKENLQELENSASKFCPMQNINNAFSSSSSSRSLNPPTYSAYPQTYPPYAQSYPTYFQSYPNYAQSYLNYPQILPILNLPNIYQRPAVKEPVNYLPSYLQYLSPKSPMQLSVKYNPKSQKPKRTRQYVTYNISPISSIYSQVDDDKASPENYITYDSREAQQSPFINEDSNESTRKSPCKNNRIRKNFLSKYNSLNGKKNFDLYSDENDKDGVKIN